MNMNRYKSEKGQTVIETALLMILLLVIFFGIAEIARAWWLKNQLNNAARVGVRVAIVTPNLVNVSPGPCAGATSDPIVKACSSITTNVPNTLVGLTIIDEDSNGLDTGDTVTVTAQGDFQSVVPNLSGLSFGLIPDQITMQTSASMRYE